MSLLRRLKRTLVKFIVSNRRLRLIQQKIFYDPLFLEHLPISKPLLEKIIGNSHALNTLLLDERVFKEIVTDDHLFQRIIQADETSGIIANPLEWPRDPAPPLREHSELRERKALVADLLSRIEYMDAKVSVIIPYYNYPQFIGDAVESILRQTHTNFEVLVMNDGSTDAESREVLSALESAKVRVIHQKNQGLSQTRNNALQFAEGDFLLFLDADDTLDENALALYLYQFHLDSDAGFVYPAERFFGDEKAIWTCQPYNVYDLMWANHLTVCIMIRREVFKESLQYQPSMKYGYEDWEFGLSNGRNARRGSYFPAPVFNHRRHGRTMTHEAHDRKDFLYRELRRLNGDLYTVEAVTEIKKRWRPLLTVITPYYNGHRYVDETIASLRAQTLGDFDHIVVDDGSEDPESIDKLKEIEAGGFSRVIRIEHAGLPAARNAGALEARGEYICFLDCDDYLSTNALEVLILKALLNPQLAFTHPGVVHFGEMEGEFYDEFSVKRLKREPYIGMVTALRRDIYLELGGTDESMLLNFEDYDFWLRLIQKGYRGQLVPELIYFYRRFSDCGNAAKIERAKSREERMREIRLRYPKLFGGPPEYEVVMEPIEDPRAPGKDELMAEFEAYYRQIQFGMNYPYSASRRTNTPNLFQAEYYDPNRINILYFIPHMVVGGAENIDLDILIGLDRSRYRVIIAVELTADHVWYERFREHCDELFLTPNFATGDLQTDKFVDYLLYAKNIDICFNRNTYMGYRAFKRWKAKFTQIRCVDLHHLHNRGSDWVTQSIPFHDSIDRHYLTNRDLKEYILENYTIKDDTFRIVYCGVDPRRFDPEKVQRGVLRDEFGVSAEAPTVGYLARFDEQKDPLKWLEVAGELSRTNSEIQFLMVGGGELFEKAENLAEELGIRDRVHFAGYRTDIPEVLADFDCLLMVSNHEGLPQAVFEAMSMGVPVVSSDAGGTRECVTPEVGTILPIHSEPRKFAEAVSDILDRVRSDSGLRGRNRERIIAEFPVSKMQELYRREFEEMFSEIDREKRLEELQIQLMHEPLFT